jgi:hypothetical protein
MDRTEAARCLAKVFAHIAVGQPGTARVWAKKLIAWLQTI